MTKKIGYVDIGIGLQWGDEGKGKIVDFLAKDYDIVARFQGGPNAGHTLWYESKKIVLHNTPSGILYEHVKNFIGPGCVVNPTTLLEEIKNVSKILGITPEKMKQRLFISKHAFIIHPYHQYLDKAMEKAKGNNSVGTTGKGIGPVYSDIKDRIAFRFGDFYNNKNFTTSPQIARFSQQALNELNFYAVKYEYQLPNFNEMALDVQNFFKSLKELESLITFVDVFWLEDQIISGSKVLAEGAQGTMLDNNFGCYSMVTASNTISGIAPVGLGVPIKYFRKTIGITKWYTTKVGGGEFPSRITDPLIEKKLQDAGEEVGATTGRSRMCGWLDIPQLKYALRINAIDELIITKVDINPLEEVEIISSYVVNGNNTREFPFTTNLIEKTMSHCMKIQWKLLPAEQSIFETDLMIYLNYIKEAIKDLPVKISFISHGPNRDDVTEFIS